MYAVELEEAEMVAIAEDDSLADVIKNLTSQQAEALWVTLLQLNPQLADL